MALKAAQEEVSTRAGALEEERAARVEAEKRVEDLRAEISALKQQHSDEQLRISNEHTNEIAEVAQARRATTRRGCGLLGGSTRHHQGRVQGVNAKPWRRGTGGDRSPENASEHWEEQLRTSYQEQEARHAAELEAARTAAADREMPWSAPSVKPSKGGWPRSGAPRRSSDGGRAGPEKRGGREELELQNVVETQQGEIDVARAELEAARRSSEERRKEDLRRIKALAEGRETT